MDSVRILPLWATVLLGALAAGCGGPWGPIPGGALSGPEIACGTGFPTDLREIEVEVRPEDPYSVTTWNVVLDGTLYIPADFLNPVKRWPGFVDADERIRLRVDGLVHRCRAVRVTDADLVGRLRAAIAAKYDIAPDGIAARTEVWWYRVERR